MTACSPIAHLPIADVTTVTVDGQREVSQRVFCDRRHEMSSVAQCRRCPRFLKVGERADEQGDEVQCVPGSSPVQQDTSEGRTLVLPRLTVGMLMTRDVVCVRPDLTLDAVVQLFVETSLRAVPVVDGERKLIGFVSEGDVMLAVQAHAPAHGKTVGDVMMPYKLVLPESATLTQAAALMAFEAQERVAVVGRDGTVVGVLSASDILYFIARADGHTLPKRRAR
jgi:CBS domain-containing protein